MRKDTVSFGSDTILELEKIYIQALCLYKRIKRK